MLKPKRPSSASRSARTVRFAPCRLPSELRIASHAQKWAAVRVQAATDVFELALLEDNEEENTSMPLMPPVISEELLLRTPLWAYSDPLLTSLELRKARTRLRHAPVVVAELHTWWWCCQHSITPIIGQSGSAKQQNHIGKVEYVRIDRLISKAMQTNFEPEAAQRAAVADWDDDEHGGGRGAAETLSRASFMDALFEVADLYTKTVDEGEYADFLHGLFEKVAVPNRRLSTWRDEGNVIYGGYDRHEARSVPYVPRMAAVPVPDTTMPNRYSYTLRKEGARQKDAERPPDPANSSLPVYMTGNPPPAALRPRPQTSDGIRKPVRIVPNVPQSNLAPGTGEMPDKPITYDPRKAPASPPKAAFSKTIFTMPRPTSAHPILSSTPVRPPSWTVSGAGRRAPRTYDPKPAAIHKFKAELSNRLSHTKQRVHQATENELPVAFTRRPPHENLGDDMLIMHSPPRPLTSPELQRNPEGRRQAQERSPEWRRAVADAVEPKPLPEFQVLNRSIFVFEALGSKEGPRVHPSSTIFATSTRQGPVVRSAGSYTPVRPSSAKPRGLFPNSNAKPGTSGSALPMPGMLKIMTPEDYAKLGLDPPPSPPPRPASGSRGRPSSAASVSSLSEIGGI